MANPNGMHHGGATAAAVQSALAKDASVHRDASFSKSNEQSPRKSSGYGLPCAKCHLYYPADLNFCPTCHHTERISAVVPKILPKAVNAEPEEMSDVAVLASQADEFLRQSKSHLLSEQS